MADSVPAVVAGVLLVGLFVGLYSRTAELRRPPSYGAASPIVEASAPTDPDAEAVAYCRDRIAEEDARIERPTRPTYYVQPTFSERCKLWLQQRYLVARYDLVSHGLPADPVEREAAHKQLSDAYNAAGFYLSRHADRIAEDAWGKMPSPAEALDAAAHHKH